MPRSSGPVLSTSEHAKSSVPEPGFPSQARTTCLQAQGLGAAREYIWTQAVQSTLGSRRLFIAGVNTRTDAHWAMPWGLGFSPVHFSSPSHSQKNKSPLDQGFSCSLDQWLSSKYFSVPLHAMNLLFGVITKWKIHESADEATCNVQVF